PVQDDEQVRVGDGEVFAGQERLLAQGFGKQRETRPQRLDRAFAHLGRGLRRPQRPEALVHLGGDETEPFHQLPAFDRAERGRQLARLPVRDVLQDHVRFRERRAVVEHQERYIALRIYGVVIGTVRQLVSGEI